MLAIVLVSLAKVGPVVAITASEAGPVYSPNMPCYDITKDQMVLSTAPNNSLILATDLAAALCCLVNKRMTWITTNIYLPGKTADTQAPTKFGMAKPGTLDAVLTEVTLPNSDPAGVTGVKKNSSWWPYGFKTAYNDLYIQNGQPNSCQNALEAMTGFKATTVTLQSNDTAAKNLFRDQLVQYADGSPIILGRKNSSNDSPQSDCQAVLTTNGTKPDINVVVFENFVGWKTIAFDDLFPDVVQYTHLTNWDYFAGLPIGGKAANSSQPPKDPSSSSNSSSKSAPAANSTCLSGPQDQAPFTVTVIVNQTAGAGGVSCKC
ncbi:hypothetical protein M231_02044 [Tremella mesenterica]|uniref:PBP domain-containing protein n=1 Tax=Tremella mesenterica TaxID=5217 RepID=A0A4Q1BRK7_TREME|nr:uncharacterized protein TREMEDRAFT_62493 [Tremella mesenterica DSM 1558]EIW69625.1 hypothetical protein TREMEDRAFT_62493 [Tremella mesenterica DSM 1558]RXK40589.1 hypothetical protein M231_02044 [Tremella mesenterica]